MAIPEDVLAFLRKDELVKSVLENENQPEMKLPQSWFSASAIHLEDRSRADLAVVGEPPLAGANVVPFWIFRTTPNGHSLVLRTGGHGLSVLRSKHNGLCDIETTSVTTQRFNDTVYRFDGSRYVIFRDTSKPNR